MSTSLILHPWADKMLAIMNTVTKVDPLDLNTDGAHINISTGLQLIDAFTTAGYILYEQLDSYYVVESLDDEKVGVIIDFRDIEDVTVCFFNDDM